jgi:hypothetical protein
VGNVSQGLDTWMAAQIEDAARSPHSVGTLPDHAKPVADKDVAQAPAVTTSSRAAEPEPDVRFCDEIAIGSARHRAKEHFRATVITAVALVVALSVVAAFYIDRSFGATTASFHPVVIPVTPAKSGRTGELPRTAVVTATYVATPGLRLPFLLTWSQSGQKVSGTITTASLDTATTPAGIVETSNKFTGTLDGSDLTLTIQSAVPQTTVGTLTATSLSIDLDGSQIVFVKGTTAGFHSALTFDGQPLVADAAASSDRTAQWGLAAAVSEVKEIAYIGKGSLSGLTSVASHAGKGIWTTGACGASPRYCISYQLVDVVAANDQRGVALATYSPGSATCWYAIDLQSSPKVIANDTSAFWSAAGGFNDAATASGVYYAKSPSGSGPTSCSASSVLAPASHVTWGTSVARAGSLG